MKIINSEEYFGLYIHLMKGENDDILDWPFEGKIFLTVKNRDSNRLHQEDFHDTIIESSHSEAFQRPKYFRNEVGIGHPDFMRLSALYSGGFVASSTCNLKDWPDVETSSLITAGDFVVIKSHVICTGNDE